MFFHIDIGDDLECPFCKEHFGIEWNTEYGDPLFGEHKTKCLNCKKEFGFNVYIEYKSFEIN